MIDIDNAAFDEVKEDIYAEVASREVQESFPDDVIYSVIAEVVRVAFWIDICYWGGPRHARPVTRRDLERWGIGVDELTTLGGVIEYLGGFEAWERLDSRGKAYCYPTYDPGWTPLLFSPTRFSELDLDGDPVIMIPDPDILLVTGHHDTRGLRAVEKCVRRYVETSLITPKPLRLHCGKWVALS
jgi:hypothetical protein